MHFDMHTTVNFSKISVLITIINNTENRLSITLKRLFYVKGL